MIPSSQRHWRNFGAGSGDPSSKKQVIRKKAAAANKDGGVALVHKVIEYDEKNEPQADVETIVYTPERPKARSNLGGSGWNLW